jgi:hypothetical protein
MTIDRKHIHDLARAGRTTADTVSPASGANDRKAARTGLVAFRGEIGPTIDRIERGEMVRPDPQHDTDLFGWLLGCQVQAEIHARIERGRRRTRRGEKVSAQQEELSRWLARATKALDDFLTWSSCVEGTDADPKTP